MNSKPKENYIRCNELRPISVGLHLITSFKRVKFKPWWIKKVFQRPHLSSWWSNVASLKWPLKFSLNKISCYWHDFWATIFKADHFHYMNSFETYLRVIWNYFGTQRLFEFSTTFFRGIISFMQMTAAKMMWDGTFFDIFLHFLGKPYIKGIHWRGFYRVCSKKNTYIFIHVLYLLWRIDLTIQAVV